MPTIDADSAMAGVRAKHPPFIAAIVADAKTTAAYRAERFEFRNRIDGLGQAARLMWVSDAFAAQVLYRAKARLQSLGIPILPRIAHRLAMMIAQVSIGDPVVMQPGVYLAHGQVVIDGFVEIHRGVVIFPWVTIGKGARIGANSVVVNDVAAHTTVVGAPARPTPQNGPIS